MNMITKSDGNKMLELAFIKVIGDRVEQQDSFGYDLKENSCVVTVCDGMGGLNGGSKAAEFTSKMIVDSAKNCNGNLFNAIYDTLFDANDKVCALEDENGERIKAGTTATTAIIENNRLSWVSVGDSRIYILRNDKLGQITIDHNYEMLLKYQLENNMIPRDKYDYEMNNSRIDALTSFIGVGDLREISTQNEPIQLVRDDRVLVMSDGLYKILSDDEIKKILSNFNNINDAVIALESKTKNKAKNIDKSRDNMTLCIIKVR